MQKTILNRFPFLFFITIGILGLTACDSDVTELSPFNRLTEADAFANPDRCELSMVGVYDAAQSGFYAGGNVRGYPFGAANVEQGDMRGEDMLNVAAFYAFTYDGTYTTTTANNDYHWQTLYGLINKANLIIDGTAGAADAGIITQEAAAAYEGESRFLRALAHHELLIHYARPYALNNGAELGVPYKDFAVNTLTSLEQSQAQGRNTVSECYTKILDDLNVAEANLPETRTGTKKITRATKGAAIALKTRIYLHQGRWSDVITEANKLIGGVGGYALTAEPEGPFAGFTSNTESIMSIENSNADNPFVNAALPVMYSVAPGRALVAISPIVYNAPWWLETDKRRTQLVKNNGRAYFSHKYRNITTQDDWNPILRYAEVLLNAAEAHARLGDLNSALDLLNQVRNRAVVEAGDQYTIGDFADANAMIGAILKERRIEFLAEGRRWADIHRLVYDPNFSTGGIPAKTLYNNTSFASWGYGVTYDANGNFTGDLSRAAIPVDNFRFIWPIPQSELNTNEVLELQQNPGY